MVLVYRMIERGESRLLLVMPSTGRGGCEEYALAVASAATAAGHALTACVPRLHGTQSVRSDLLDLGADLEPWPVVREHAEPPWGTFSAQLDAARDLLARVGPAVALIILPWTDSGLGVICACARLGVPALVVFQLASARVRLVPEQLRECAAALRGGQVWAVTSRDNAGHVAATFRVGPDELRIFYNGVAGASLPDGPARTQARTALAREVRLPAGGRIALTVARLSPDKGHADILRAERVSPVPGLHYVWAGDGEARNDLQAAVRAAGLQERIHLLGYRADVDQLLAAADLFVFPTRAEGASFALLEAMAAGLGIVASDASSNPELVGHGEHGLLYRTRDASALAGSVGWALGHEREMILMGRAEGRRAAEHFSSERMIRQALGALDELRRQGHCRSGPTACPGRG